MSDLLGPLSWISILSLVQRQGRKRNRETCPQAEITSTFRKVSKALYHSCISLLSGSTAKT